MLCFTRHTNGSVSQFQENMRPRSYLNLFFSIKWCYFASLYWVCGVLSLRPCFVLYYLCSQHTHWHHTEISKAEMRDASMLPKSILITTLVRQAKTAVGQGSEPKGLPGQSLMENIPSVHLPASDQQLFRGLHHCLAFHSLVLYFSCERTILNII